jgi:hypothetical protein
MYVNVKYDMLLMVMPMIHTSNTIICVDNVDTLDLRSSLCGICAFIVNIIHESSDIVATLVPRRRMKLTNESSITLSIKPRMKRQKRMLRICAMSLQWNIERVKQRILPEPLRSRAVFQFLDLPRKLRVRGLGAPSISC